MHHPEAHPKSESMEHSLLCTASCHLVFVELMRAGLGNGLPALACVCGGGARVCACHN